MVTATSAVGAEPKQKTEGELIMRKITVHGRLYVHHPAWGWLVMGSWGWQPTANPFR